MSNSVIYKTLLALKRETTLKSAKLNLKTSSLIRTRTELLRIPKKSPLTSQKSIGQTFWVKRKSKNQRTRKNIQKYWTYFKKKRK